MRVKHEKIEKPFYEEAYREPATRIKRGYGWDVKPSPSMVSLFKKNILANLCVSGDILPRVLDIGIGADGRNAEYFLKLGYEVLGLDISENAISTCGERLAQYVKGGRLKLFHLDMSTPNIMDSSFDIVIDWSVMDHIRREYLKDYKKNICKALRPGGFLLSAQFADPMPEKFKPFKGKDYYLWNGHYMRCFTLEKLKAEFSTLKVIDCQAHCDEDRVNRIMMHNVLFQKQ